MTYKGTHQALVDRETWEQVQPLLNRRAETNQHRIKHDFAFTGFVRCGHCQCCLVGELKKQKYVYYHCTGHRGKCPEPRELQSQSLELLRRVNEIRASAPMPKVEAIDLMGLTSRAAELVAVQPV